MTAVLADELARARGEAVRVLLARPLLDQGHDPDPFRLVAQHRVWLTDWFERTCGWTLHVDVRGGLARLAKRRPDPDPTRPAVRPRRSRAAQRPFDRRRYELLCLVCADLVRRPATTIALLAAELESVTTTDPALTPFRPADRQSERRSFVDVLNLLAAWGVVSTVGGDVADYVDDAAANAIVEVDQSRIHHLLATSRGPSTVEARGIEAARVEAGGVEAGGVEAGGVEAAVVEVVIAALTDEPRYRAGARGDEQDADAPLDDEQANRWRRHSLMRRLLDDPVVEFADLTDDQRAYVTSQAGRQWLRERVAEAGLVLEERAEGWAAVDPDALATDRVFPGPGDNVKQAALLLLDRFVEVDQGGARTLVARDRADLEQHVRDLLARHRGWNQAARTEGGDVKLAADATRLLADLGLVHRDGDRVRPRPLLARYTSVPPRTSALTLPIA